MPLLGRLLRVRLFYKILVANAAIIGAGAIAGTWFTARAVRAAPDQPTWELIGLLAIAGVVLSLLVNAIIVRLALAPLDRLEHAAKRVREGDLEARVPDSPLADREFRRVTRTFNAMLDGIAEYRQRRREVAARALHAAEEERKRLARELHDDTAQRLVALVLRVRELRSTTDPERRDAVLDELRRELTDAIDDLRRFARGLRPPALDELGLVAAIEAHARGLADATGLAIEVHADSPERFPRLSPEAELALYRIVQEALANVVRHAQARHVRVEIRAADGAVAAAVRDDGRGFAPDAVLRAPGQGLGLLGMLERAAYVAGTVEIRSEPGGGATVRARVPTAT